MARSGEAGRAHKERLVRLLNHGPQGSKELTTRQWLAAFWRTMTEFVEDDLTDRAATLTYYAIMSVFPGLLVIVAGIGFMDDPTARNVVDGLKSMAFGPTEQLIGQGIQEIQKNRNTAGLLAIGALVIAFWSATGYIGAFMRAANAIFDVPEGRPLWKMLPVRLLITLVTGIFLLVSAVTILFTGRAATQVGMDSGMSQETVDLFAVLKWPALALIFAVVIAVLYWAAPNAHQGGFRWVTPGSIMATIVWVAVSGGLAFYIARFDSYDKAYGTIGGVIAFLLWMWLTNVAILLGAEFDAEIARAKAIAAGLAHHEEPYLPMREVPKQEEWQELQERDTI